MTVNTLLDIAIAASVLLTAVWTLAAGSGLGAVTGFVAYGVLLSLIWVRLAAVDVALTEVAIGGGATGVLLMLAAARLQAAEAAPPRASPGAVTKIAAAALSFAVAAALAAIVLDEPASAPTLAPLAVPPMAALGLGNAVTAVLLAYRSFDTLMEGVVLLLALIGVWSLTPGLAWIHTPDLRAAESVRPVLGVLARALVPPGLVVAIYTFWAGTTAPGGKFQAGTVLGAMWLIAMMAGVARPPRAGDRRLRLALVAGPAVFLAIGLAGLATAGAFLAYPSGAAKPLILAIEAAMMVSIAATLAMTVAGPPPGTASP